jgi:hypothetical protein
MNLLLPAAGLALLFARKQQHQKPPPRIETVSVQVLSPMELAEVAAKTSVAEGEHPEEAEVDAFETYLLNGGRDVFAFANSISVNDDHKNPTLERWQTMAPDEIEDELSIETTLSQDDIVIVVNNYLRGARRAEIISGFGTGGLWWAQRILIGGGVAFVLGPAVLPGILFSTSISLLLRNKRLDNIVHDLVKEAQRTGADIVILPANLPPDNPVAKELVSRLSKVGFGVRFTGPASNTFTPKPT